MFFVRYYIPCFGMKIQYLNKPPVLSNEQSPVQHDEEKEVVYNQKCGIESCL